MEEVLLGNEYLISDIGTSDGTQDKYLKNGIWYKTDRFGGEGKNEALVSRLLSFSTLKKNEYVSYKEIRINGSNGCYSQSFLLEDEECVSVYRLHQNVIGTDIAAVLQRMDFDDQSDYVLNFLQKETKLSGSALETYFGKLFQLDYLALNDDRHLNNICLIFNGTSYRPAPIFDNGKSFFCGNKRYQPHNSFAENLKTVHFKPFTATIEMMIHRFPAVPLFNAESSKLFLAQTTGMERDILAERFCDYFDEMAPFGK